MDEESRQISKRLDDMVKEYNDLTGKYNKLIEDTEKLNQENREKAYEIMNQQEQVHIR